LKALGVILGVVLVVILGVVLVVIGLVVASKLSLASIPNPQVLGVVGAVAALLLLILVLVWQVRKPTQESREQDHLDRPPKYPRYDPSIRAFTVFFAAVLGFGLKNLLDQGRWLFFLVATFIFLRFLTAAANNLWLEHLKYERDPQPQDFLVVVGFFWITVFGCFGAYLCYADAPTEFFRRACALLSVTLVGSGLQWLWFLCGRSNPIGHWGGWFSLVNFVQLAAVVVYWSTGVLGLTWGIRLSFLAVASAVILGFDFYWQLKQVAK
jgi:hypothetical protein